MSLTRKYLDNLTYEIIGCAITVHKELGPALIESVYEKCFIHLLKQKGFSIQSQQSIPIEFRGISLDAELRYDILVENLIIVENKAIETIHPIHMAKLMSYMKLLKKPKGVMINFHCNHLFKEGVKTYVNEFYSILP